jgi:hypothetical protein
VPEFDDDLLDDEQESEPEPQKKQDNQAAAFERLKRKHEKELTKAREDAERSVRREFTAKAVATKLGFTEGVGTTFLQLNADQDPTEETIKGFAEGLGLQVKTEEESEESKEPEPQNPVAAAAAAFQKGGGGTPTSGKTYTPAEIRLIGIKNEAEALRIIAEGRMQIP